MKKNFLGIALALCTMLFASCSQDENLSGTTDGNITISVKAPIAQSRATVTVPTGYSLKCIMQLLDSEGATVGSQKSGSVDTTTGQVTFTVTGTEQATAVKALFWADFVPASGTKVYNTSDLKAVTYNTTAFDMTNTNLMAACDAFCGVLTEIVDNATVTLVRPFTQLTVTPTNPDEVSAATTISVAYTAPSSYSVLTGDCTGSGTALTYTNSAFTPASGAWFTTLVFAPVSTTYLSSEVKMTLGGGVSRDITIPANKLPLDANMAVTGTFTIEGETAADITISATVNPDYTTPTTPEEPATPEMAVGSYINAKGEVVTSSADAIGIVFQMGAIGNDVAANYPEAYQSKTIKGYAVALENTAAKRAKYTDTNTTFTSTDASITNGTQTTTTMLALFLADFQTAYNTWVSAHPLTGENLSAWYIPTLTQLEQFIYSLYANGTTSKDTPDESKLNATLKAMSEFSISSLNDRTNKNANYISSTVNPSAAVSGIRILYDSTTESFPYAQSYGAGASDQVFCRPMITIFE